MLAIIISVLFYRGINYIQECSLFLVCSSTSFDKHIQSCNPTSIVIWNSSNTRTQFPHPFAVNPSLHPRPPAATELFCKSASSLPIVLPFPECHRNGIIWEVAALSLASFHLA